MSSKTVRVLRWIPALFIIGVSCYLSSKEHIEAMPTFFNADKLVHLVCFAGLAFWVAFGFDTKEYSRVWIPVVFVMLYGAFDELHQSCVPGRMASVYDWLFDAVGGVVGSVVYVWARRNLRRRAE